jgi:hypothetical protein
MLFAVASYRSFAICSGILVAGGVLIDPHNPVVFANLPNCRIFSSSLALS